MRFHCLEEHCFSAYQTYQGTVLSSLLSTVSVMATLCALVCDMAKNCRSREWFGIDSLRNLWGPISVISEGLSMLLLLKDLHLGSKIKDLMADLCYTNKEKQWMSFLKHMVVCHWSQYFVKCSSHGVTYLSFLSLWESVFPKAIKKLNTELQSR